MIIMQRLNLFYDPTLWDMFLRSPNKLNELIWELFDKGVIRYSEIVRNVSNGKENEMERFLQWTHDNQFSYEDLVALKLVYNEQIQGWR